MKGDICLVGSKAEAAKAIFVVSGKAFYSRFKTFSRKSPALAAPPYMVPRERLANGPIGVRIIRESLLSTVLKAGGFSVCFCTLISYASKLYQTALCATNM
jgi:hypothetical protein